MTRTTTAPTTATCAHCGWREAAYTVTKPGEDAWPVCEDCAPATSEFATLTPLPGGLRERVAELAVLTRFDMARHVVGHDYGGAQRGNELRRRERELKSDDVSAAYGAAGIDLPGSLRATASLAPTEDELRAAAERVLGPRLERIAREDYRRSTPATRRTVRALEQALRHFGAEVSR